METDEEAKSGKEELETQFKQGDEEGLAKEKKMNEESFLQQQFCHWLDSKHILYNASLAGVNLGGRVGRIRKIMGAKRGYPDIEILEPNKKHHSLFIELKSSTGNTKDPYQLAWQEELNKRRYLALIMPKGLEFSNAFNWLRNTVEQYINNKLED